MTDIVHGERLKKVFRMLLILGYKYLKKDMKMISHDLQYNQNPVVRNLNALMILSANELHQSDNWQKNMVLGYGQGGLWAVIKDTAYREYFFWTLDKLLEHAEELREMLKPYVKPPEEWTPNLWQKSIDKTNRLKREKKIPMNSKSLEESIYTPQIQEKRHKKYMKKKK